jgi:hypothetical protein
MKSALPVSTGTLGGVAPNGRIMAGVERAVQSPKGLKAFNQSHWLVSTPRLLGLSPSLAVESRNQ